MNIVLVSACEKKAITKTRSVLDRYAFRIGDSTWTTGITEEGLESLHVRLRSVASKNTAVLCLRRDRRLGLVPLWIVGNRSRFGPQGQVPIFITEKPTRKRTMDDETAPGWSMVKRIAAIGGLFHDLGKNNRFFAQKILLDKPLADPIRHEWISLRLIESLWEADGTKELDAIWQDAIAKAQGKSLKKLPMDISDAFSAVRFCVATHHRLLNEEDNSQIVDGGNMIRETTSSCLEISGAAVKDQAAPFPQDIAQDVSKKLQALRSAERVVDRDYWRAVALLARIALILADHWVSSRRCDQGECRGMSLQPPFANTRRDTYGKRVTNQTLQWHLQSVEQQAAVFAHRIQTLGPELEGLCEASIAGIDVPPALPQFQWQEDGARAIERLRHAHPHKPMLIAVISGTGSGKTRACARFAVHCAIGDTVRFTSLFNLRTLTLQTGNAYRHQLGIQPEDLAVVIGDAMTRKAFEAHTKPENEDEMDRNLGEDVDIFGAGGTLPEWLAHFVGENRNLKDLLAAPVFVSTADYLAPAGDPGAQGRHIMPLLRLMYSDLILDEIDNYDTRSVVAILRLVQWSAFFGRNVIASSATLTPALAKAMGIFYEHGARMRAAFLGRTEAEFACAVISDSVVPSVQDYGSADTFHSEFQKHIRKIQEHLCKAKAPRRKATLLPLQEPHKSAFLKAIENGVSSMHRSHQWMDPQTQKPLSVGLVRVANIRTALWVAKHLRASLTHEQIRVACYHSRLFRGQRLLLEQDLDQILYRAENPAAPAEHPSIRQHLQKPDVRSGLFVVVATPVEEVGRDHDFDWAIVEPSSTQSIVQIAGRVRRHRDGSPKDPNIGILQYNWRKCEGNSPVFTKPGNETSENTGRYGKHDMADLLCWDRVSESLDARLRFDTGTHPMAHADEAATEEALDEPTHRLTQSEDLWVSAKTYTKWALRDTNFSDEWRYDPEESAWFFYGKTKAGWTWLRETSGRIKSQWNSEEGAWLVKTHSQILSYCDEHHLDPDWALSLSVVPTVTHGRNSDLYKLIGTYDGIDFQ